MDSNDSEKISSPKIYSGGSAGFISIHKETYKVIKNNLFGAIKFTAPFIVICFFWNSFIGERYVSQVESVILAMVIVLPATFSCIFVLRNEFIKEYKQRFFELFFDKNFLLIFFYFLSPKLIDVTVVFINGYSRIEGFEEFYWPLISLLSTYFWFRYINFIFCASLFKSSSLESIVKDHRGLHFKNFVNIALFFLYAVVIFLIATVFIFNEQSVFPNYLSKPFFILFSWIIGLFFGLFVSSSLVVINKAKTV